MDKTRRHVSRTKSRARTTDQSDFGPAWVTWHQALDQLGSKSSTEDVALLVADALRSGRITLFGASLSVQSSRSDDWPADKLSRQAAGRDGLLLEQLAGPTRLHMPLAPAFWHRFVQLEEQLSGGENDLLSLAEPLKRGHNTWEVRGPVVSIFQLDLLQQQIDLRSFVPPKAKRKGGRPRESRWHHWTAHLVDHLLNMQFPMPTSEEVADTRKLEEFFEEAANEIIQAIDARLVFEDGVKLELRDTQPTVVRVLRYHLIRRGALPSDLFRN